MWCYVWSDNYLLLGGAFLHEIMRGESMEVWKDKLVGVLFEYNLTRVQKGTDIRKWNLLKGN